MANPEHLQILQQGVVAWNAWQEQNEVIRLDLTWGENWGCGQGIIQPYRPRKECTRLVDSIQMHPAMPAEPLQGVGGQTSRSPLGSPPSLWSPAGDAAGRCTVSRPKGTCGGA
jgi:hypothetical protein